MSTLEGIEDELLLYLNESGRCFGGVNAPPSKTPYTVLGVPFDSTSTYKSGARWGPGRIREAAANIEFYSFRAHMDFEEVMFHDVGDLAVVHGDVKATLHRLSSVVKILASKGRIPVVLGGEHTVTYGCVEGLMRRSLCVVVFDAHFDLRDEYMGVRLGHASVVRRLVEMVGPDSVVIVGVRAGCREEVQYARRSGLTFITSHAIGSELDVGDVVDIVRRRVEGKSLYLSVDMDVFDPAYAPGVGNPEPEGLSPRVVLDIIHELVDESLVGLDVVEVTPPHDVNDVTSVLAAKVVVEAAAAHYSKSRG